MVSHCCNPSLGFILRSAARCPDRNKRLFSPQLCTHLASPPSLYCCSPSLMGDSANAPTVRTAGRWASSPLSTRRDQILLPPAVAESASSPLFHPSQRFSQRHDWTLQVLGPQLPPNRVPTDDILLAGRVVVFVASSAGLALVPKHFCHVASLRCGRWSRCASPQTCSASSPAPLPRRPCRWPDNVPIFVHERWPFSFVLHRRLMKARRIPASPHRRVSSSTSSRTNALGKTAF